MFGAKIWFFLIGGVAALAISVALIMPRPAQRIQETQVDPERVTTARASVEILLRENARKWVDAAAMFARVPAPPAQPSLKLDAVLAAASKSESIPSQSFETARNTLQYIMSQVSGTQKPEFVIALDAWGRVVARVGVNEKEWGDDMSGYFLVRDALRGYLRDDLWYMDKKLYRVAAAPVIARAPCEDVTRESEGLRQGDCYVGAVVLGDEVDLPLAKALEQRVGVCPQAPDGSEHCEPHVAFFVKDETVAASDSTLIGKDIYEGYARAKEAAMAKGGEFKAPEPFTVKAGDKEYLVAVRPLPGEVAAQDGFYAVFSERSKAVGFWGTLHGVTKEDVGFHRFPWIPVAGLFVLAVFIGLFLMWWESDRPLKRLVLDAVALGKGEVPKLDEDRHAGKYGSVARSVNIGLEKLQREAKASRKDLGAVLGPAPDDGILGGGARALPPAIGSGGGSPFAPPPPSDFSFEPPPSSAPKAPLHLPSTPAPARGGTEPAALPQGPGFDFDMPAPPPPLAAPPSPRQTKAMSVQLPELPSLAAPPSLPSISGSTDMRTTPLAAAAPRSPSRAPMPPAAPPPLPPVTPPPPSLPRAVTPPPRASMAPPPSPVLPALDDDILAPNLDEDMLTGESTPPPAAVLSSGGGAGRGDFGGATVVADPSEDLLKASADGEAQYFREVFDDFVELKRKCGEPVDNLTYEKFAAKLRANRDALVNKYNCKAVKFQVYVKDGKAALKATPVKA